MYAVASERRSVGDEHTMSKDERRSSWARDERSTAHAAALLSSRPGMVRDREGLKVEVANAVTAIERESISSIKGGAGASEWRMSAASTAATSSVRDYRNSMCGSSSSDASSHSNHRWRLEEETVPWHEIRLGDLIRPHFRYAHCTDDVHLLASFLELSQLSHIHGSSVKLLLRTLWFLRLCDYSLEDICSILVHASSYFVDAYALCGNDMDSGEVGNVLATLMFIAHCYVQDETCPLGVWHRHLFRKYCALKTLNAAVIRLLEIRRHILRLPEPEQSDRYARLVSRLPRHCQRTIGVTPVT